MLIDLSNALGTYFHDVLVTHLDWWLALGFVAQGLFTARFVVQWIASERAGKSVMPIAFWFFSIGGGLVAARLRALPARSGVHRRPGVRGFRLRPQSFLRVTRPARGDRSYRPPNQLKPRSSQ